jgi:hypothetical protein
VNGLKCKNDIRFPLYGLIVTVVPTILGIG